MLVFIGLCALVNWKSPEKADISGHAKSLRKVTNATPSDPNRTAMQSHPIPTQHNEDHDEVLDSDTRDLCGISGIDRVGQDNETVQQHVTRITNKAISAWKTTLLNSDDPRRHAVGLVLENANPHFSGTDFAAADTRENNMLVVLAIESNDPAIYALALGICGKESMNMTAGPCQGLSVEHWAQIDPDNAIPWMWIASRANQRGDYSVVNDALVHATNAAKTQSYSDVFVSLGLDALPSKFSPLEKATAGADLISVAPMGVPITLTSLCSQAATEAPLRKKQCLAFANRLETQGTTILDVAIAQTLSQQLGWPEDRANALRLELEFSQNVMRHYYPWSQPEASEPFHCNKVQRYNQLIDQLKANKGNERDSYKNMSPMN